MPVNRLSKWLFHLLVLAVILIIVSLLSLSLGPSAIPLKRLLHLIIESRGSTDYTILFDIRLPRVILGFATGGALSLAGVVLQGMFRNPLVEPYTTGISGGAALGVSLGTVLHLSGLFGPYTLPVAGFAGAVCVVLSFIS